MKEREVLDVKVVIDFEQKGGDFEGSPNGSLG
jgi:hypothetical protein